MIDTLEIQRKRLFFRSKHRGTKEADLLFGAFAEAHLADFDAAQLATYETLLDVEDPDLWDWVISQVPIPSEFDTDVMRLIQRYKYTVRFS